MTLVAQGSLSRAVASCSTITEREKASTSGEGENVTTSHRGRETLRSRTKTIPTAEISRLTLAKSQRGRFPDRQARRS